MGIESFNTDEKDEESTGEVQTEDNDVDNSSEDNTNEQEKEEENSVSEQSEEIDDESSESDDNEIEPSEVDESDLESIDIRREDNESQSEFMSRKAVAIQLAKQGYNVDADGDLDINGLDESPSLVAEKTDEVNISGLIGGAEKLIVEVGESNPAKFRLMLDEVDAVVWIPVGGTLENSTVAVDIFTGIPDQLLQGAAVYSTQLGDAVVPKTENLHTEKFRNLGDTILKVTNEVTPNKIEELTELCNVADENYNYDKEEVTTVCEEMGLISVKSENSD